RPVPRTNCATIAATERRRSMSAGEIPSTTSLLPQPAADCISHSADVAGGSNLTRERGRDSSPVFYTGALLGPHVLTEADKPLALMMLAQAGRGRSRSHRKNAAQV